MLTGSSQTTELHHGGRLQEAAQQYGIPASQWLDLSTGINPNGWPVPPLPASCWLRLPEDADGLIAAAAKYYGAPSSQNLLAVAGSQAAIQALPTLRACSRVAVLHPAYAEHEFAWRKHGHEVVVVDPQHIDQQIADFDVVLLINPNNPTAVHFGVDQLLSWRRQLVKRGGWLIVDEAFMDATPECSVISHSNEPGLIVLRSIGKFFGLAGARVGFVAASGGILQGLRQSLGPWTLAGPSRWVVTEALLDRHWQAEMIEKLPQQGLRLKALLTNAGLPPTGGCSLFQWVETPLAAELHISLAEQAVLSRYFAAPKSLRFGLPADANDWNLLESALKNSLSRIADKGRPTENCI